jgi:threonine synthase
MRYRSTRGGVDGLPFVDAVTMGLGTDGGLLVPARIPDVRDAMQDWSELGYADLAVEIIGLYVDDISDEALRSIIDRSYATFDDPAVTPLRTVGDIHVLELFHGPTLAFKDVALQFLGNVFEHILADRDETLNILGATSGDTGSAAIAGVKGRENINIFIMFPDGKTSPSQELQMTTVPDANVHALALRGSFDDCQAILKGTFGDLAFKERFRLAAVNSVNWARIVAQIVYYFSAYFQLGAPRAFNVAVPTGNFGNIFAAYLARQMGLPIHRLILATNGNDILSTFFNTGVYRRGEVQFSLSPAMDIQVSSNFERYLYYCQDADPVRVHQFMESFAKSGEASLAFNTRRFDEAFLAASASDEQTLQTITHYFERHDYLMDPHTAVGVSVAARFDDGLPLVCVATAHPAKFGDVIQPALPEADVSHPTIDGLAGLPTRKTTLEADVDAIKTVIEERQAL